MTHAAQLIDAARAAVGPEAARPARDTDTIDGRVPAIVLEPADAHRLAAGLAWANETGQRVVVRGGGTKIAWGPACPDIDVVLSTRRLDAVTAHRHGDLTATVQAGATLATVNRALAEHGQWIPLDPPDGERATIGGIVATNDSGPRRHRYGTPRDLIIGVEIVRPDGRLAKAGGIVVKNVAGYDLARLLAGSFGSLAVLVSVSVKLAPLAPASRTVVVDMPSLTDLAELAGSLAADQLVPTAIEVQLPERRLLVRFETTAAAAIDQSERAGRLAADHRGASRTVDGEAERDLWAAHGKRPWAGGPGAVLKLSMPPAALADTLSWIARATDASGLRYDAIGRAAVGVLLARLDGDDDAVARFIVDLRDRFADGYGSAALLRGSVRLKGRVDAWGPIGSGAAIMRAVKQRFDPRNVLNPGRGPGGI